VAQRLVMLLARYDAIETRHVAYVVRVLYQLKEMQPRTPSQVDDEAFKP
jgi:hypothetical protein